MTTSERYIKADEGKVFRRKGTNEILGNEIYLGYSFYIEGVLQQPPHYDVPEDFEEIDIPGQEINEEVEETEEEASEETESENINEEVSE